MEHKNKSLEEEIARIKNPNLESNKSKIEVQL